MADITEFDRMRIHDDLVQLNELVERKQWLWETDKRPEVKEALAQELEQASAEITRLNALLA